MPNYPQYPIASTHLFSSMKHQLSCPLCRKPHFDGVEALRNGLITIATTQLHCPVCDEVLMGLDKLTIHLFKHSDVNGTLNETEEVEEKIAEEINQSIDNLTKESEKIVATPESDALRCDICNFSFNDRALLEMHQNLLHQTPPDKKTGIYSYHCHLCSKKFKMRGSLMVHLRVAHYGFSNPANGNDSTSNVNTEESKIIDNKQWECEICQKMFTTKYFLKKHKRLHTGEMPYFCAQCNKSFTFQQSYHKHMLYHSSEKPYVCKECNRAFKELSTLQNHARIHSGERPFKCETCGKSFRQKVSYLVHQRIHTGVMPYKCSACSKSFRYKVSQRTHKCPMNPPGSVLKVSEIDGNPRNGENSVNCVMAVDYSTGNINFIPEKPNDDVTPSTSTSVFVDANFTTNCDVTTFIPAQLDLVAMVLQPTSTPTISETNNESDNYKTIL